ncbi:hypothetical protein M3Y94_01169900 [Aphelenchoides besseyi]|nr:hypothetical protein M3Y94_01169900 [Aphelenchoides besseyi]KAI6228140.1 hypothetical protein M3Y95_00590900 [Aphelenchoides besseyi]
MAGSAEIEESMKYRSQMYARVIPIFLILNCVGISWNVIVIWALRRTKMRNATSTLILSLTVSDAWTSFIVSISLLYNSFLPIVLGTQVNPCFSLTLEILRTSGLLTGTLLLLFISLHHYVVIVRPHCDQKLIRRTVGLLSLVSWAYPVIVLVVLSMAFKNEGYYNCYNVRFYHSRVFRLIISFMLLSIFLCIIFFYARLLCILRTQTAKWRSKATQTRASRENRMLWTAILICSSFFVGWAPASIHFATTCSTCELLRNSNFRTLFLLSCGQLSFLLLKSFANPLIYAIRLPEVDAQIRSMIRRCMRSNQQKRKNKQVEPFLKQIPPSPMNDREFAEVPPPSFVAQDSSENNQSSSTIQNSGIKDTTVRLSV